MYRVTKDPIWVEEIEAWVKEPSAGAVVTFDGIVRNNAEGRAVRFLEYEAYPEMAEKCLGEIGEEVKRKWHLNKVAMVHRIGRLAIGESSIVISVSAPHRADAFAACQYAMDRVKESVPIWKKECFEEGAHWVNID